MIRQQNAPRREPWLRAAQGSLDLSTQKSTTNRGKPIHDAQSQPLTGTSREMSKPVVNCRSASVSEVVSDNVAVERIQLVRQRIPWTTRLLSSYGRWPIVMDRAELVFTCSEQ
jgi:hypothetical protein